MADAISVQIAEAESRDRPPKTMNNAPPSPKKRPGGQKAAKRRASRDGEDDFTSSLSMHNLWLRFQDPEDEQLYAGYRWATRRRHVLQTLCFCVLLLIAVNADALRGSYRAFPLLVLLLVLAMFLPSLMMALQASLNRVEAPRYWSTCCAVWAVLLSLGAFLNLFLCREQVISSLASGEPLPGPLPSQCLNFAATDEMPWLAVAYLLLLPAVLWAGLGAHWLAVGGSSLVIFGLFIGLILAPSTDSGIATIILLWLTITFVSTLAAFRGEREARLDLRRAVAASRKLRSHLGSALSRVVTQEQHQRFSELLKKANTLFTEVSGEGIVLWVSPASRLFTGLEQDEVTRTDWLRSVHPEDQATVRACLRQIAASGNAVAQGTTPQLLSKAQGGGGGAGGAGAATGIGNLSAGVFANTALSEIAPSLHSRVLFRRKRAVAPGSHEPGVGWFEAECHAVLRRPYLLAGVPEPIPAGETSILLIERDVTFDPQRLTTFPPLRPGAIAGVGAPVPSLLQLQEKEAAAAAAGAFRTGAAAGTITNASSVSASLLDTGGGAGSAVSSPGGVRSQQQPSLLQQQQQQQQQQQRQQLTSASSLAASPLVVAFDPYHERSLFTAIALLHSPLGALAAILQKALDDEVASSSTSSPSSLIRCCLSYTKASMLGVEEALLVARTRSQHLPLRPPSALNPSYSSFLLLEDDKGKDKGGADKARAAAEGKNNDGATTSSSVRRLMKMVDCCVSAGRRRAAALGTAASVSISSEVNLCIGGGGGNGNSSNSMDVDVDIDIDPLKLFVLLDLAVASAVSVARQGEIVLSLSLVTESEVFEQPLSPMVPPGSSAAGGGGGGGEAEEGTPLPLSSPTAASGGVKSSKGSSRAGTAKPPSKTPSVLTTVGAGSKGVLVSRHSGIGVFGPRGITASLARTVTTTTGFGAGIAGASTFSPSATAGTGKTGGVGACFLRPAALPLPLGEFKEEEERELESRTPSKTAPTATNGSRSGSNGGNKAASPKSRHSPHGSGAGTASLGTGTGTGSVGSGGAAASSGSQPLLLRIAIYFDASSCGGVEGMAEAMAVDPLMDNKLFAAVPKQVLPALESGDIRALGLPRSPRTPRSMGLLQQEHQKQPPQPRGSSSQQRRGVETWGDDQSGSSTISSALPWNPTGDSSSSNSSASSSASSSGSSSNNSSGSGLSLASPVLDKEAARELACWLLGTAPPAYCEHPTSIAVKREREGDGPLKPGAPKDTLFSPLSWAGTGNADGGSGDADGAKRPSPFDLAADHGSSHRLMLPVLRHLTLSVNGVITAGIGNAPPPSSSSSSSSSASPSAAARGQGQGQGQGPLPSSPSPVLDHNCAILVIDIPLCHEGSSALAGAVSGEAAPPPPAIEPPTTSSGTKRRVGLSRPIYPGPTAPDASQARQLARAAPIDIIIPIPLVGATTTLNEFLVPPLLQPAASEAAAFFAGQPLSISTSTQQQQALQTPGLQQQAPSPKGAAIFDATRAAAASAASRAAGAPLSAVPPAPTLPVQAPAVPVPVPSTTAAPSPRQQQQVAYFPHPAASGGMTAATTLAAGPLPVGLVPIPETLAPGTSPGAITSAAAAPGGAITGTVPAGAGAAGGTAVGGAAPHPPPTAGFHILFVDDEAVNRRLGERMLRRLGCTAVMLDDGDLLPQTIAENPKERAIDAILLDIYMQRSDGAEVCAELRRAGVLLPIIAMTGTTDPAAMQRFREAGFDLVLPKPFDIHQMSKAILEGKARRNRANAEIARQSAAMVVMMGRSGGLSLAPPTPGAIFPVGSGVQDQGQGGRAKSISPGLAAHSASSMPFAPPASPAPAALGAGQAPATTTTTTTATSKQQPRL